MRGHRRGRQTYSLLVALAAGAMSLAGLAPSAAAAVAQHSGPAHGVRAAATGQSSAGGPGSAPPAFITKPRTPQLPRGERLVCGVSAQPGQMECQAVVRTSGQGIQPAGSAARPAGYGPSSLQNAYGLTAASARRGRGETIAIVDAYSNPDLVANLASYRSRFGLPACTTRSGCLRIVNQSGRSAPLPRPNVNWGVEEALDLDMVSAICPHCRILLVEATSNSTGNLGIAEDTAAAKSRFVSNSWAGGEFVGQDAFDHYFNHPGDAVVFASGDFGYGAAYPADTQYVTSVGGTRLTHRRSGRRAWTETVWGNSSGFDGSGSGCSTFEAKPSWQGADDTLARGCLNRTENDVSADADPATGVAVYDTYRTHATLITVGGTSVATPIITAVYGLAGSPARGTYPAAYLYRHATAFNHVTSGVNGRCERARQYLCHGERGYSGPAGLGTPHGIGGFSSARVPPVTVLDPGTQDVGAGAAFRLAVRAVDSDRSARSLSYSASGLPAGLTIGSASGSLNGTISGVLPATAGSYQVTVTARDARTRRTGTTRFMLYVIPSMATSASLTTGPGPVSANPGGLFSGYCLSAGSGTVGTGVMAETCDSSASQKWEFLADAAPGMTGTLVSSAGPCLGLSGTSAVLQTCDGGASQEWEYQPSDSANGPATNLYSPVTGKCLNGGKLLTGPQHVVVSPCSYTRSAYGEDWALSTVYILSGLSGLCLSQGNPAAAADTCVIPNGSGGQEYWQYFHGILAPFTYGCLAETGPFAGRPTSYVSCSTTVFDPEQVWLPGPGGELINSASGKCLDSLGAGRHLVQQDCYGLPGEVWAIN